MRPDRPGKELGVSGGRGIGEGNSRRVLTGIQVGRSMGTFGIPAVFKVGFEETPGRGRVPVSRAKM